MTDPNDTPERDATGRFVSRKEDAPPPADDRSDWHPLARGLFGWAAVDGIGRIITIAIVALGSLLILADGAVKHKISFDIQNLFGFYGVLGLAAFAAAILLAWPLGRVLKRDPDYYDGDDATGEDS